MAEGKPKMMMAVSDEGAALQFFVEAMKANTAVLEAIREDSREDRRLLNDIHGRVIKIESNRLDREVRELSEDVKALAARTDTLEKDKDRRDGAVSLAERIPNFIPWLLFLAASAVAYLLGTKQ